MTKVSKFSFINRRILILIIGLGLIFSFLPLQKNNTVYAASCLDYSTDRECQNAWAENQDLNCYWDVEARMCRPVEWCPGCGAEPWKWGRCFLCLAQYIGSIPLRIAFFIPAIILALFSFATGLVYALTIAITNWIAKVAATVPISPSSSLMPHDFVVTQAWEFTRDFANMFFILILVFIGLATILKLREYQAKKALPLLIIIALLINFTPVIVGFIVDITNLVTIFFLDAAGSFNNLNNIVQKFGEYIQTTLHIWSADGAFFQRLFVTYKGAGPYFAEFVGIVVYGLILTAFYIFGSIVYFFVGILFFTRILFLWILMILAPIAFISYIFPATKKLYLIGWDSWWEELVKWSIIGIPIGFFLYLSNFIMNRVPVVNTLFKSADLYTETGKQAVPVFGTPGSFSAGFADLFVSIIAPMLAITLLYLGTKFAKKLAPEMAIKIVDGVKKGMKIVAMSAVAAATMGAGAGLLARGLGGMAAGAARAEAFMGRKLPKLPLPRGRKIELGKWMARSFTVPARELEKIAGPPLRDYAKYDEKRAIKAGTEAKNRDFKDNLAAFRRSGITLAEQREILLTMIDLEQEKNAMNPYVAGKFPLQVDEILKVYEDAEKKRQKEAIKKFRIAFGSSDEDVSNEMAKIRDRITANFAPDDRTGPAAGRPSGLSQKDIDAGLTNFTEKIAKEIKTPEDMKHLREGWWNNAKFMEAAQKFWGGPQLGRAADIFGRRFVDKYMETAETRPKSVKWFLENNQNALMYLTGNAAQDAGYRSMKDLSRDEARDLIYWWRVKRPRGERYRPSR